MVVPEQCGMRRLFFSVERVERGSVDKVDVEPAIIVVVDQAYARAVGFDDEVLFGGAHLVSPAGEARLLRDVLEDHGARIHKAARCNRSALRIVYRRRRDARRDAAHPALLRCRRLLGSTTHITAKQTNQGSPNQTATAQKYTPLFGAVYRTALVFAVTHAAPVSAMGWKLFCNRHLIGERSGQ